MHPDMTDGQIVPSEHEGIQTQQIGRLYLVSMNGFRCNKQMGTVHSKHELDEGIQI